jgi:cation transport ATPase
VGRRSRRRAAGRGPAHELRAPGGAAAGNPPPAAAPSRSDAKDAAARARLTPLAEGERPRAVTVGAVVAVFFAVGNLAAWFAGLEVRGDRQPLLPVAVLAALLLVTAWGMWRARYWAVLAMQALLALTLLTVGLFIFIGASPLVAAVLLVAVVLPGGALFWFLVRAMARIQMPRRR